MTKGKTTIIFLSLMALLINVTTATAQDDAAVQKEIEAQYQKLAEAHIRKTSRLSPL
jgi:hypothetical protein